jgi:hypothetical protein
MGYFILYRKYTIKQIEVPNLKGFFFKNIFGGNMTSGILRV